jgi:hypothetical protein
MKIRYKISQSSEPDEICSKNTADRTDDAGQFSFRYAQQKLKYSNFMQMNPQKLKLRLKADESDRRSRAKTAKY